MKEFLFNIVWITSGSGLILYPFILLANVMSFAGHRTRPAKSEGKINVKLVLFKTMLVITTLFPLIYYVTYKFSRHFLETGNMVAAIVIMIPCLLLSGSILWFLRPMKRKQNM